MKTLKQQLQDRTYNYIGKQDLEDIIKIVKQWLETHQEMIDKIQYKELYTQEVIPFLIKRLGLEK